jgi:hypothetical protein
MEIDETAIWVFGKRIGNDVYLIRLHEYQMLMFVARDTGGRLDEVVIQTPRDITKMTDFTFRLRRGPEALATTHKVISVAYRQREMEVTSTVHPLRMWPIGGI